MPTTNTGRPFAWSCRDAGRTRTRELFCRETRAGCPSLMRACCCGLEALNETVSPAVMQPVSAEQAATKTKIRTLNSPAERVDASATGGRVQGECSRAEPAVLGQKV